MADKPAPPERRRWLLELRLGADTFEGLVADLLQLSFEVSCRSPAPAQMVSGSMSGGYTATITEDPSITAESYRAAVERWMAEREEA